MKIISQEEFELRLKKLQKTNSFFNVLMTHFNGWEKFPSNIKKIALKDMRLSSKWNIESKVIQLIYFEI